MIDVTQHLHIAYKLARWMHRRTGRRYELADMLGDAMLGLVIAGRKFDESYGVTFYSFAAKRVLGEIKDGLERMDIRKETQIIAKEPASFVGLDFKIDGRKVGDMLAQPPVEPTDVLMWKELRAKLPRPDQREVYDEYLLGYTASESAELHHIKPRTVSKRRERVIAIFRTAA